MSVTVSDLFCGAGGSSLGATWAGMELRLALNHWQLAIDVHQQHFPDAAHDCADISQVDPRRYPRTDVLLASPECTNHSQARGVSRKKQDPGLWDAPDPSAERSRATMWDVCRFAEQMHYPAIVVENVIEATKWVGWRGWSQAMADLGYDRRILSHNSQDHGVPQSRDRIYVVFWKKGLRLDLEMERDAWCPSCDAARTVRQGWKNGRTVGRYRTQWVWCCTVCGTSCEPSKRPAAEIIDWTLDCPRIGDRKRPLSEKTRARILAGLERYGYAPIVTAGAGNGYETTPGNRARPLTAPLATQTTTAQSALAMPFLASITRTGNPNGGTSPVGAPMRTQTSTQEHGLVIPLRNNGNAYPTTDPLGTVTAGGNHHGLLFNTAHGGRASSLERPHPTVCASDDRQSLLMPYYGHSQARPADRPLPTVTTKDRCAVIDPETVVDDCGFRMLEPHEVAAAMAFPDGYIPSDLTKKDRVKLAGNAVTPPTMQWITGRIVQALENAA